jgi:hypothetical protein
MDHSCGNEEKGSEPFDECCSCFKEVRRTKRTPHLKWTFICQQLPCRFVSKIEIPYQKSFYKPGIRGDLDAHSKARTRYFENMWLL